MASPQDDSDAGTSGGEGRKGREAWGKDDTETDGEDGDGWRLFARDLATSIAAVLLLGTYLFAISGVWPPMVAIESGSMEPNMEVNDLAFVMDTDRFQPGESITYEGANATVDTGIVTAAVGEETGYTQFGASGDVIVFRPDGEGHRTPIIHRAMFWVEDGEDWTQRADPDSLGERSCEQLSLCPAPHSGFITKGDNNPTYDQIDSGQGPAISAPVRPAWVIGTAEMRIPFLGWFRLRA